MLDSPRKVPHFAVLQLAALLLLPWTAFAQQPAPPASQSPTSQPPTSQSPASQMPDDQVLLESVDDEPDDGPSGGVPENFESPYSAYDAGVYEQALQGFVDEQVEHPEDPDVALNLGSVHYQMKNYEDADRAFLQAALAGDDKIRGQAFYNLGNSAYRQGDLQKAVDYFRTALDSNPDDEDAKYNLEFVRDEIRRRHEEAQKRQQEQDQQQQGDQQQQDQQQGDQQQDQQQGDQQQEQQQQGGQPQDSDGDGLGDEQERSAQNPTDPQNPDTDGDGLPDGQEDQNKNGQVDEGETDPNNPDSDGDGTPDGQQGEPQGEEQGEQQQAEAQPGEEQEGLTPEEAERYLQGLEEGQPQQKRKLPKGSRRARPEKDW